MEVQHKKLLGMGNPLLDISAEVNEEFLQKYDLLAANAILAEEKHVPIYEDMIKNFEVKYIAGGATQNSIRVAQWSSKIPEATNYFGCIANDKYGEELRKVVSADGVNANYDISTEAQTGTCAVLVTHDRSLVANLAAANHYKIEHLRENWSVVEQCDIFYSAGFFLTVSPASIVEVGKHTAGNNKILCMNISAPFLVDFFAEPMMECFEYCDYIFGNESEALAFGNKHNYGTEDIKEIARKMCDLPKKGERKRIVVITQGKDATIVAQESGILEFPVELLPKEKIVDTNGAGDSFVGGFLSKLMKNDTLENSVECGHACARMIIQVSGCDLPTS